MPKPVQIRDISDDVYEELRRPAAEVGLSVAQFMRREAEPISSRMTITEWLSRTRGTSTATNGDVQGALDELRGDWPG